MNAIMGPTGCGKSTLLDALAGRKDPQKLTGYVLLDGWRQPANVHRHMCGYVVQDNVAINMLTVRENIAFSAALRLPRELRAHERRAKVSSVIEELGLILVADRLLGTEYSRGLSGGERKRTCIGIELVKDPSVLFLDEPTTGLDAYTAGSVMKTLRRLADAGRTIVFSIHQPKYSIYRLFDRLTLISDGKMIYHGLSGQAPIDYFSRLGYFLEGYNNPADFLMDTLHGEVNATEDELSVPDKDQKQPLRDHVVQRFVLLWRRSDMFRRLQTLINEIAGHYEVISTAHSIHKRTTHLRPRSSMMKPVCRSISTRSLEDPPTSPMPRRSSASKSSVSICDQLTVHCGHSIYKYPTHFSYFNMKSGPVADVRISSDQRLLSEFRASGVGLDNSFIETPPTSPFHGDTPVNRHSDNLIFSPLDHYNPWNETSPSPGNLQTNSCNDELLAHRSRHPLFSERSQLPFWETTASHAPSQVELTGPVEIEHVWSSSESRDPFGKQPLHSLGLFYHPEFSCNKTFTHLLTEAHSKRNHVDQFRDCPYTASFEQQLVWLCYRQFLSMVRCISIFSRYTFLFKRSDYKTMLAHFVVQLVISLFLGIIYYKLDKSTESGIQNRSGLFFLACVQLLFINSSMIDSFLRDRAIFRHQSAAGFYRISAYLFAKIISEVLPVKALPALLFMPITYMMAGLRWSMRAFLFWELTLTLLTICASGIAFSVSTMVTDFRIGATLLSMFFVLMMITSGFLINVLSLGVWLSWLRYFSILRLAISTLLINEVVGVLFCPLNHNETVAFTPLTNLPTQVSSSGLAQRAATEAFWLRNISASSRSAFGSDCVYGQQYLETQAIDYSSEWAVWQNELGIFGIFVLALINAYIYLRFMKKYK
ncbi:ATP-binding cassette, subfamily G (WHITE), member 2 [Paragonimus westermani]|uniref:ATP-binding cassette, subfamily G (WHITE), member 2 n=1 Tax=Paragonimus westermani TaxID=34504 RepID=A0A5J4P3F2_9TREM|nr:ATP-binding cassette, subfamily G (WHITE), member 2 [Paragonimus westermani]